MQNTKLAEKENQALVGVVCHFLEAVVDVGSLFEHGKAQVVDVSALFFVGSIRFCYALGKVLKTIHESIELLLSGLNDVLHGLVDSQTGEQHWSVCGCGNDAHLLESGKAVVGVKSRGIEFLCKFRGFHFWARA